MSFESIIEFFLHKLDQNVKKKMWSNFTWGFIQKHTGSDIAFQEPNCHPPNFFRRAEDLFVLFLIIIIKFDYTMNFWRDPSRISVVSELRTYVQKFRACIILKSFTMLFICVKGFIFVWCPLRLRKNIYSKINWTKQMGWA